MTRTLLLLGVLFVAGCDQGGIIRPLGSIYPRYEVLEERIKALEEKIERLGNPPDYFPGGAPYWCDPRSCNWNGAHCICLNNVDGEPIR